MEEKIIQAFGSCKRKRKYEEKYRMNQKIAAVYDEVNPDKAQRMRDCAPKLSVKVDKLTGVRTFYAWFCRVRLCAMCGFRRSLKTAAHIFKIMEGIKQDDLKLGYLFLTLTQRNCQPEELEEELTKVLNGFNYMTRRKQFKDAVVGYYRTMEVTHNLKEDTYHPHIHVVLAIDRRTYYKGINYIAHKDWVALWRKALKLGYDPNVDIRKVKGTDGRAVAEAAKYAVKYEDYLIPTDWDLSVRSVRILDSALHKRRFIAYGGVFKEYHKRLNLEDPNNGDLSDFNPRQELKKNEVLYHFAFRDGYYQEE